MGDMGLIKKVYARWKASRRAGSGEHPDEETLACFLEGLLSRRDEAYLKEHILDCPRCAEIIAAGAVEEDEVCTPLLEDAFIRHLKSVCPVCEDTSCEAEFSWKDGVLRLLRAAGKFTLREYAVEDLSRGEAKLSRGLRKAVLYRKTNKIRLEIIVSGQEERKFSLQIKAAGVLEGELRAALFCRGRENESQSMIEGRAVFCGITAGDHLLEISTAGGKRLAAARLVLKTD
ncbi:MAG: hypothetical protein WBE75_02190 [Candidatus Omnitrophota bacterium]